MFVLGAAVLGALVVLMRPMWRKRLEERSRKVRLDLALSPRWDEHGGHLRIALAFQMTAWVSLSLYVGMVVRALYDVTAGFCYGAYGEKLGYPIEPMPP